MKGKLTSFSFPLKDPAVPELMPLDFSSSFVIRVVIYRLKDRIAMGLRTFLHTEFYRKHACQRENIAIEFHAFTEIDQTAALGVNRQTCISSASDRLAKRFIHRQLPHACLRETASDIQPVQRRQTLL